MPRKASQAPTPGQLPPFGKDRSSPIPTYFVSPKVIVVSSSVFTMTVRKAKEYIAAEEIYHLELCNGSRIHPVAINQPLASR